MTRESPRPDDQSWVVGIHKSADGTPPIGTGFLIDGRRVVTARHVLEGLADEVWVSFPKVEPFHPERRHGQIRRLAAGGADAAIIVLDDPAPPGAGPIRIRLPPAAALAAGAPIPWWAFGFPDPDLYGNEAHGVIGASLGQGALRLDTTSEYVVARGFSGSGVWSSGYDAVVGIVIQAKDGNARAITLHQIAAEAGDEQLDTLASEFSAPDAGTLAMTQWGWSTVGDPETRLHWRPRARGVTIDSEQGFRFRGRTRALTEIVQWLDRPTPDRRALVVTGSPGVGKSAVLGRIVTTADPELAREVSSDGQVRATPGSVACAVHAKGKTAFEVAVEVARAASAELPTEHADAVSVLRTALEARSANRFNVVIDALDEAATSADARQIMTKLVRPLVETCADVGAQVVLGTRRTIDDTPFEAWLAKACEVIDLDHPDYFELDDLEAYCVANLTLEGGEREGNPYDDPAVARPVGAAISRLAAGNFLVAGLIGRSHGLHDGTAVRPDEVRFEATVQAAMDEYLRRLSPVPGLSPSDLLTALAFAEAPGWTPRLWAIATQAVMGKPVSEADLVEFARSTSGNFLIEKEDADAPSFRLFHQALNDALLVRRGRTHPRQGDEAALVRALRAEGTRLGWGITGEGDVDPYLRRHLSTHAATGNVLSMLLDDPGYILTADPVRLTAAIARGDQRMAAADVYRDAVHHISAEPIGVAASYLELRARQRGRTAFADTVAALPIPRDWRVPWARWTPGRSSRVLADGDSTVTALTIGSWRDRTVAGIGRADGSAEVWDLHGAELLRRWMMPRETGIRHAALAVTAGAAGSLLVAAGSGGDIAAFALDSNESFFSAGESPGVDVTALCTAPTDGQVLCVTAYEDLQLVVRELPGLGVRTRRPDATRGSIYGLSAMSVEDRQFLVSAGDSVVTDADERDTSMLRIWDPDTLSCLWEAGPAERGALHWIALGSVAGKEVAVISQNGWGPCQLWDLSNRRLLAEGEAPSENAWLHEFGDVTLLLELRLGVVTAREVTLGDQGDILLRDPQRLGRVGGGNRGYIVRINGRTSLVNAVKHQLRLWDLEGMLQARAAGETSAPGDEDVPLQTVMAADDARLYLSGGNRVMALDIGSGVPQAERAASGEDRVDALATYGGRKDLVVASTASGSLRAFTPDLDDSAEPIDAGRSVLRVQLVRWHGEDLVFATVLRNSRWSVRIWDLATREERATHAAFALTAGEEDKALYGLTVLALDQQLRFAFASKYGKVMVADLAEERTSARWYKEWRLPLPGFDGYVHALASAKIGDEPLLVAATDRGDLTIWAFLTGSVVASRAKAQRGAIDAVEFGTVGGHPLIASGGDDGRVCLWTTELDQMLALDIGDSITALAWTGPDGLAVSAGRGVVKLDLSSLDCAARGGG